MTENLSGFCYVEVLEPHLTFEGPLSDADLFDLHPKPNAQKELFPLGINGTLGMP